MTTPQKRKDFHVLSLGAGKQSTFMLLKSLEGFFGPIPDKAVFCDLGAEPDFVYRNLDNLQSHCLREYNFTIDVLKLPPIDKQILDYCAGHNKKDSAPPFYLSAGGVLRRHCTEHYKIRPIRQYLTPLRKGNNIFLWIGISMDEIERMKNSSVFYITHKFPLIEKKIHIQSIRNFFSVSEFPEPGKSACYFCPFHSHNYWRILSKNFPTEFKRACDFDNAIRNYPNLSSKAYLHSSLKPLDSINFSWSNSLFPHLLEECEGLCGL